MTLESTSTNKCLSRGALSHDGKKASGKVKHMVVQAIKKVLVSQAGPRASIGIADLGCSSGPHIFSNMKDIVEAVEGAAMATTRKAPKFRVYLNNLPTNDFNTVFQALPIWHRELKTCTSSVLQTVCTGYPGLLQVFMMRRVCLYWT